MNVNVPPLGPDVPTWGGRFSRAVGRWMLGLFGFGFEGSLPNVPRGVMVIAPHTSNWDFPVGLGAMLALGLRADWMAKHTIFRGPTRRLFLWLGGVPVDRSTPDVVNAQIKHLFDSREQVIIAVAPEGTRTRVTRWKSGFHRFARAGGVPILPVAFDWGTRKVRFYPAFEPTEDYEADQAALKALFDPSMAVRPEHFWGASEPAAATDG